MLKDRREFKAILENSSLAEDKLWVNCPSHGRQARDPFEDDCVLCVRR